MKNLLKPLLLAILTGCLFTQVGCKRNKGGQGSDGLVISNPDNGGGALDLGSVGEEGSLPGMDPFLNAVPVTDIALSPVYFAYDSSVIGGSEQAKVQAAYEVLASDGKLLLSIEGHCDERGSREYNHALSDRRALAVRDYLMTLGIDGNRMTTVPQGEEFPAALGHDESAWSLNRRGEFKLLRQQ